jgi:mxaL protein
VLDFLRQRREIAMLLAALLFLLLSALRPTIPLHRDIHTYLLVVDITQSMNAVDMQLNGKPASRISYTRSLLHDVIASMPCNTRVGIAIFSGVLVTTLFEPVEVCGSFSSIQDAVEHLEWREASHGNSRLGFGMLSAAGTVKSLREPAQVIFFTDGEEAPHLHAFNRADLTNWQGGNGWLLVGIGSDKPTPIPKMDENNKVLGYWSLNTYELEPGIAQVSDETRGKRDDGVATQDHEKYLSRLDEDYLKALAKDISADYLRGNNMPALLSAMEKQKPARRGTAPFYIDWLLSMLAGLLLLAAHLPEHPRKAFKHWLNRRSIRALSVSGR